MAQSTFTSTIIPILIILAFALFMWYKLRVPLGRFWEWLKSMMSSGKDKAVNTARNVQLPREIVYDI
jgi:fructose-specific phosphotransferase system IIC component